MSRGLSERDEALLEALQIFMDDFGVIDIDLEPKEKGAGYNITCSRKRGDVAFAAWGKTVEDAITNVVKSANAGRR